MKSVRITSLIASLFILCLPAQAQNHDTGILPPQQPEPPVPIRLQRPLLVEFGGTFPKLPGLGVTYNLNQHLAIGLHGSYLHLANSLAVTGRYYFSPEASSLFTEFDVVAMSTSITSGFPLLGGVSGLLGYEYRSDNGFTLGAGVGLALSIYPSFPTVLPALSLTLGHAF